MSLINLKNVSVAFGADPILDQANLIIESNERIGLIGRNGAGKSTLLKMIDSKVLPDDGELLIRQGTIVGRLVQEVPSDLDFDIRSVVALGDDTLGQALADYYLAGESDIDTQTIVTELEAWGLDVQVQTLCSRFDLDPNAQFSDLSGGMKRRVLMARALVKQPDILLLDEPTNHLDIATINWLEHTVRGFRGSVLFITHDRAFLQNLATRIVEIDRGLITSYPGNFQTYLATKAKALEDEDVVNAKFDKRLAQEEVWIRKGIQARRTRNEGRVRALKQMRDDRSQRRERQGTANISLNAGGGKSGKVVIEAESLHASFDSRVIMRDFSCRILRGDKVGIIGPNGCGKSTLIKVLTGENQPHGGKIKIGTNLEIAYLDQHRSAIRDDLSVQDNVSGNNEITINGQTKHIMGYLQDFLFSPSRARAPAAKLSGGERNRLMLAKLFTQPFNFLVLDEPTNDLDYETLELLEQLLMDYTGTLLLVSHDRTFLDNVVTSTIAFEGDGEVHEYIGGYEDWLRQKRDNSEKTKPKKKQETAPVAAPKAKKLSYNLQRELEQLPKEIDALEKKIEAITLAMAKPKFYQQEQSNITQTGSELKQLQDQLDQCFVRWEELEG